MSEKTLEQLIRLSTHLTARRESILLNLRTASDSDPQQTKASALTRAQFEDHIPRLLEAFERKLRARPGSIRAEAAEQATAHEEVKHGLERWQQGYRLGELTHEWGHLHLCLADEIAAFCEAQPDIERATIAAAHRELIRLISEGVNESVGQYAWMQQAEAVGHMRDLQVALAKVNEIERRRAKMIHEAVHDLRTNVLCVSTAAEVLRADDIAESERREFASVVQQGCSAVGSMLGDLLALARLEAGQERRELTAFDAGTLLQDLCTTLQPLAAARDLFFRTDGPAALPVEGDKLKIRRLAQNLVSNALKYTAQGGVTVSWGEEKESWWIMVRDTGPGLETGPSAPIAEGMKAATDSARETAESAAETTGESSTILPQAEGNRTAPLRVQQPGEGIGLSIVKRLCELLDASLELATSAETGTAFRVLLPRQYHKIPPGDSVKS